MPDVNCLGPQEVAALLGVERATVKTWRYRRVMPDPDAVLSGVPVWRRDTIEQWARDTGRAKAP